MTSASQTELLNCNFDDQLMGPILDTRGLEQGGILSSEAYKLYNNEQAITAQRSGLGASLGFTTVSCISLADMLFLCQMISMILRTCYI